MSAPTKFYNYLPAWSIDGASDLVVDAAGTTGRKVANMVGLDFPMRPLFSEAMITEPYPELFKQMIGHAKGLFYGVATILIL